VHAAVQDAHLGRAGTYKMNACTPDAVPCSAGVGVPIALVVVIVMYMPRTDVPDVNWLPKAPAYRVPTHAPEGAYGVPGMVVTVLPLMLPVAGVPVTSWHTDMPVVLVDWPFITVDADWTTVLQALSEYTANEYVADVVAVAAVACVYFTNNGKPVAWSVPVPRHVFSKCAHDVRGVPVHAEFCVLTRRRDIRDQMQCDHRG